jgi:molybdenum cofactor synthesis domain-containing protein
LGWQSGKSAVIADDQTAIANIIKSWRDLDIIFTTGGTGISARDVTPEATRSVIEREVPGLAELMRSTGLQQTRRSVLSRGVVGAFGQTLVVNLPGSPRGAVASLQSIEDLLPHVVQLLRGDTEHD